MPPRLYSSRAAGRGEAAGGVEGEGPGGRQEVGHVGGADERHAAEELGAPHGDGLDGPLEGEPGRTGRGPAGARGPRRRRRRRRCRRRPPPGPRPGPATPPRSSAVPLPDSQEPLHQAADDAEVGRGEGELEPDVAGDLHRVEVRPSPRRRRRSPRGHGRRRGSPRRSPPRRGRGSSRTAGARSPASRPGPARRRAAATRPRSRRSRRRSGSPWSRSGCRASCGRSAASRRRCARRARMVISRGLAPERPSANPEARYIEFSARPARRSSPYSSPKTAHSTSVETEKLCIVQTIPSEGARLAIARRTRAPSTASRPGRRTSWGSRAPAPWPP